MVYGPVRGSPPLPNATILVTFTDPGMTEHTQTATTDNKGMATFSYAPDKSGAWTVMTWYEAEEFATRGYGYAYSDQASLDVSGGTEPTTSPTPNPSGVEFPME